MKITENQQRVLRIMTRGKATKTARECFTTIATMVALRRKGLVAISLDPPRSSLSPSTMIEWSVTEEGYAITRNLRIQEQSI